MRIRRVGQEERGISAVVTAVSLVGLMAALTLSVDAGNLWQTRRNIITATDATALQEARTAALLGPAAACQNWNDLLVANAGSDVQPIDCNVTSDALGLSGYVTVEARKPAAVRFGGVLGLDQQSAYSMSAAEWGLLSEVEGLRPIGICLQNAHVQGYLKLGLDLGIHPSAGVHRIMYTKDQPTACGTGSPGNWGFMDFDGGSNSNSDLVSWLLNGYPGTVGVNDCNADGASGDSCQADTGSSGGSISSTLSTLRDSGEPFTVVVFDTAVSQGGNVRYRVFAFLGVKLRNFRVTGPEALRYFDFEFTKVTVTGNCCTATGRDTGVYGARICAVDHDPVSAAVRCL
ncbi:MAG: hypothetical protein WDA27_10265 [Actinomycetota bacterium]